MSSILEQINSLTEQFSNLFEVEGLGDPASDVPPSTNKIKKDRKTKDGKVELVSVEDELFPYDGNKREQYRQKIIDTINAMIQGTATLEDLLQIVRQKKMPVKEGFEGAIEILENLREQIDKKIKAGEINLDKALKLDKKIEDKMSSEKNAQEYYEELDKRDKKERLGDRAVAKSIRRNERKNANEGFEGAIEILEDLFSTILKQPEEKQGSLVYKYHQAKNKENAGKDTYTQAKEEEKRKSKEEKGQEKTEQRKLYKGKTKEDWKQGRLMDQIARKAKSLGKVSDPAVTKSIERHQVKKWKSEGFEGAIELLEDIHAMIDKHGNKIGPKSELHDLMRTAQREAALQYAEEKGKPWGERWKDEQDFENRREGEDTKNYKGQRKTTEKQFKGFGTITVGGAEPSELEKKIRREHAKRDGRPVKEGFEGAIEILEELINEVSDKTAQGALDKAKERYNRKGYEASMKLFQGDSKGAIEDGNKAQDEYNKHINMQLRRAKRQGKKLVQDKNDHDSFKIEEAQELLEEIINEVSVGALARATENNVKKRQEAHRKSTEALKKAYDSYEKQSKEHPEDEQALYNAVSKLSSVTRKEGEKASHVNDLANLNLPKDSKVSANKLFNKADKTYSKRGKAVDKALEKGKGRGDREFDTPMKKFSRAVDLAVADPVVSRRTNGGANESYTLSELFDRPDLLDDISMALTNKTIKQHLENQAEKLLGGKKKKKVAYKACEGFDNLEENGYNIIRILEEIVNEVSNGKIKDLVTDRENLIDGAKELENLIRTDADKKLIKDAIIRDQHRVEVVKDKLENRIVNKARAEHEEGKKKKKKEGE